jgi:hypothetical protein
MQLRAHGESDVTSESSLITSELESQLQHIISLKVISLLMHQILKIIAEGWLGIGEERGT